MKRTISLLSVLALVFAFSGSAFAQPSISANANVVSQLSYSVTNSVDFATINADLTSYTPTINPNDGSSSDILEGSPSIARVNISGSSTEDFNLSFPATVTLSEDSDGDTNTDALEYTPTVSGTSGNQSSASGGSLISTTSSSGTTSADSPLTLSSGAYTLWFGGSLAVGATGGDSTVETGTYSGDFTITIDYAYN